MNRRFIISWLACAFVGYLINRGAMMLVQPMLLSIDATWRPFDQIFQNNIAMYYLLYGFIISYIFQAFKIAVPQKGWVKILRFALLLWLITVVPESLFLYLHMPFPYQLIGMWGLYGLITLIAMIWINVWIEEKL